MKRLVGEIIITCPKKKKKKKKNLDKPYNISCDTENTPKETYPPPPLPLPPPLHNDHKNFSAQMNYPKKFSPLSPPPLPHPTMEKYAKIDALSSLLLPLVDKDFVGSQRHLPPLPLLLPPLFLFDGWRGSGERGACGEREKREENKGGWK